MPSHPTGVVICPPARVLYSAGPEFGNRRIQGCRPRDCRVPRWSLANPKLMLSGPFAVTTNQLQRECGGKQRETATAGKRGTFTNGRLSSPVTSKTPLGCMGTFDHGGWTGNKKRHGAGECQRTARQEVLGTTRPRSHMTGPRHSHVPTNKPKWHVKVSPPRVKRGGRITKALCHTINLRSELVDWRVGPTAHYIRPPQALRANGEKSTAVVQMEQLQASRSRRIKKGK